MSTDRWDDRWPCACGRGEVIFSYSQPDNGYSKVSFDGQEVTCRACAQRYVVVRDVREVANFTGDRGKRYLCFVERREASLRSEAGEAYSQALRTFRELTGALRSRAIAELEALPSVQRRAVVMRMFGFTSTAEAKTFIARRQPHTFVFDALSSWPREVSLATYYGLDSRLGNLHGAVETSRQALNKLGRPPAAVVVPEIDS